MDAIKMVEGLKANRQKELRDIAAAAKRKSEEAARLAHEKKKKELAVMLASESFMVEFYGGLSTTSGYHEFNIPNHDTVYMAWMKEQRKLREPAEETAIWFTEYHDDDRHYIKADCLADALIQAEKSYRERNH